MKTRQKIYFKVIVGACIIIIHTFFVIGLINLYEEENNIIALLFAAILGFMPTIIAMWQKYENTSRILLWNILFLPIADFLFLTDNIKKEKEMKEDKFICESCNETFGKVEKTNKSLKIGGLILIYGLILFAIESIPTDNISNLLPRFILDMAFFIIAMVHILITLFKDNGRGKCPHCSATDFIYINSVKGQKLLKEIEEIRKHANKQEVK